MPPSRRDALRAFASGLTAALAGCLSASEPNAPTANTTGTTETENPASTRSAGTGDSSSAEPRIPETPVSETAAIDASVTAESLQPAVAALATDAIEIWDDAGQYLFLRVDVRGDSFPAPDDFAFRFDGRDRSPVDPEIASRLYRLYREDAVYDGESASGLLLFELPEAPDGSESETDVGLRWPGGEWRPPKSVERRILAPNPPLSASADVPGTVGPDEQPTIAVTIENGGDLPGRFVGGVNRSDLRYAIIPLTRISVRVPAGETRTWTFTDADADRSAVDDGGIGDGDPDVTYDLVWPGESLDRGVRFTE